MHKISWKLLAISVALPLVTGALSSALAGDSSAIFQSLRQPPLSPPSWVFPVAWTVLFVLMGVASYLVLTSEAPQQVRTSALALYGLQLAVNFFWSILFFRFQLYGISFLWLLLLWGLIVATIRRFSAINHRSAKLLLPYLLWVTFAGYLNLGIYILNS